MDSVVGQSLRDIEILCLNDGSTDGTLGILQEYAARDSRIRIIDKANTGYGDSMNRGLNAAKGDYIGIVEPDNWVDAHMFETLWSLAGEHDCDLVKSNFYQFKGEVSFLVSVLPVNGVNRVLTPREFPDIFWKSTYIWTDIFRREWLNKSSIRFSTTPGASFQYIAFGFKTLACAEKAFFTDQAFTHYRCNEETSPVMSRDRAYGLRHEYREIERFLAKDEKFASLVPLAQARKFHAYYRIFSHLPRPAAWIFFLRASREFRRDYKKDRVHACEVFRCNHMRDPVRRIFRPKHSRLLGRWAFQPWLFLFMHDKQIRSMRHHKVFRVLWKWGCRYY